MKRHYYISEDLDDLETVERDLEEAGVSTPQIHVLSEDEAGLDTHNVNRVEPVLKKDVVHGTERGAIIGFVGAIAILALSWLSGLTETYTWVPPIFLAIVVLGFCTWEGGLIGIQEPHTDFRRFQDELRAGKHVLFVDIEPDQEPILRRVADTHPKLRPAGEGAATPRVVVRAQDKFTEFMKVAP